MKQNKSNVDTEEDILLECMEKNVSMACYRLPNQNIQVIIQNEGEPDHVKSYEDLNHAEGFLIIPFESYRSFSAYLIRPDIMFDYSTTPQQKVLTEVKKLPADEIVCSNNTIPVVTSRDAFIEQIKSIQSHEHLGQIEKLVLSRIDIEPRRHNKTLEEIFLSLCSLYPNAFVYFFKIPNVGCWMGATPEPFLVLNHEVGIIESIAGTMWLNDQHPPKLIWGKKELEEQDIVTRFIEQRLQSLGILHFHKEGPETTQAGKLAHLRTRFIFPKNQIEKYVGEFIHTFHPTPSVGGYPQDIAYRLISTIEKHKREFYTGIVGPLHLNGQTALFANIRCMKILKDSYWLYLGAGITRESIPELEWEETNLKKTTILAALKHNHS